MGPNLRKKLLFERNFEAKLQVLVKLIHQKRNKKAFGSILVRNPNFDNFERNFFFFKRNFQAKIGLILLPFTDRLSAVNDCNLPVTDGKTK